MNNNNYQTYPLYTKCLICGKETYKGTTKEEPIEGIDKIISHGCCEGQCKTTLEAYMLGETKEIGTRTQNQ